MLEHQRMHYGWLACLLFSAPILLSSFALVQGTGQYPEQVLLQNVQVLTLRQDHMTSGRRSSPVPQINCVGGTAGCSVFVPQVIQCYNRGSDGSDVQWECKTDMDNAYRFGRTDVSCEGFSHADDPYILKGSCGVEYTLDYTKEHYDQSGSYGGAGQSKQAYQRSTDKSTSSGGVGSLIFLGLLVVVVYLVYTYFIAPNANPVPPTSQHPFGAPPPYSPPRHDQGGHHSAPPPPGFKPEFTHGSGTVPPSSGYATGGSSSDYFGGGATGTGTQGPSQAGATGGMGNFMTGAATGGLLGYLFGSRTNTGYNQPYARPGYGNNNEGSWGGGGGGSWFSGGSRNRGSGGFGGGSSGFGGGSSGFGGGSSGTSTGTRTASGFGGTNRR